MTTSNSSNTEKITNTNSLKSRNSLISVARVPGGGVTRTPITDNYSLQNPHKTSREYLSVSSLFPQGLREDALPLIKILEEYYKFTNDKNYSGVSTKINSLFEKRNMDFIDPENKEQLTKWFYEFGRSLFISDQINLDQRIFLKNISSILRQKGSFGGINSFFRAIYNIKPNIYVPWEDVLIASDGQWDGEKQYGITLDGSSSELKGFVLSKGEFTDNKGFLDDNIYLQDSFYYQQYSYDIGLEIPPEKWEKSFKSLLHPSGFILFATLILVITASSGKMSTIQYGLIDNIIRLSKIIVISGIRMQVQNFISFTLATHYNNMRYVGQDFSTRFIFADTETSIADYGNTSIAQLEAGNINANSYIKSYIV